MRISKNQFWDPYWHMVFLWAPLISAGPPMTNFIRKKNTKRCYGLSVSIFLTLLCKYLRSWWTTKKLVQNCPPGKSWFVFTNYAKMNKKKAGIEKAIKRIFFVTFCYDSGYFSIGQVMLETFCWIIAILILL